MNDDAVRSLTLQLRRRQGELERLGRGNRKTFNLGKGVGIGGGLGATWLLVVANPALGAVVAAIALVNYAVAALNETEKTGEYRPLLGRKSLTKLVSGLDKGAAATPTVTVEDDALYLDDAELGEWLLLRTAMPQTVEFLSQYEPEHRDEVLDLAATEAYRLYGYIFRGESDSRALMKLEAVGQYAFEAVRQDAEHYLSQSSSDTTHSSSAIGAATRLGAVDVPSTPLDMPSEVAVSSSNVAVLPERPALPNAYGRVLADPFQSRAIFGSQRTGKSLFAAVCSASIAQMHNTQVFHVNLASFGDEDSRYWKHTTQSVTADLSACDTYQAKELIKAATAVINQFYVTPNSLLIVDEIAIIGSSSNRHKAILAPLLCLIADKITTLASSGKKRRQCIWTIAPEFVAGALTQDTKAIKKLALCYLSITPGKCVEWEGQSIGASVELHRQLEVNYTVAPTPSEGEFECDRIAQLDGMWMPVGELPSLDTPLPQAVAQLEKLIEEDAEATEEPVGLLSTKEKRDAIRAKRVSKLIPEDKPELSDDELIEAAIALAEWLDTKDGEVPDSKLYDRYAAVRKGFTRPQFRYLLTFMREELN